METTKDKPLICPSCGYDLRGSTMDRCSECGESFSRTNIRTLKLYWEKAYTSWDYIKAYIPTLYQIFSWRRNVWSENGRWHDPRRSRLFARINTMLAVILVSGAYAVNVMIAHFDPGTHLVERAHYQANQQWYLNQGLKWYSGYGLGSDNLIKPALYVGTGWQHERITIVLFGILAAHWLFLTSRMFVTRGELEHRARENQARGQYFTGVIFVLIFIAAGLHIIAALCRSSPNINKDAYMLVSDKLFNLFQWVAYPVFILHLRQRSEYWPMFENKFQNPTAEEFAFRLVTKTIFSFILWIFIVPAGVGYVSLWIQGQ